MAAGERESNLDRVAQDDVLKQEIVRFLGQQMTHSWLNTSGDLATQLDSLYAGFMPSQMKRRKDDPNYPGSPSHLSRRLGDPEFQEMLKRCGISVVFHSKSNGGRKIELSRTDTAKATAERDMANTRRGGKSAHSLDDFDELFDQSNTGQQDCRDSPYSKALRRSYPIEWLRQRPAIKLNQMSVGDVLMLAVSEGII